MYLWLGVEFAFVGAHNYIQYSTMIREWACAPISAIRGRAQTKSFFIVHLPFPFADNSSKIIIIIVNFHSKHRYGIHINIAPRHTAYVSASFYEALCCPGAFVCMLTTVLSTYRLYRRLFVSMCFKTNWSGKRSMFIDSGFSSTSPALL